MKKILLPIFALIATLGISVSANAALSLPEEMDLSTMKVMWSDEFEGTTLDTSYWSYDIGNGDWGWGNNESEYYTNSTNNVYVSDGTLKIKAIYESVAGKSYTSGRIKTSGKVELGNGYVEARIKLPSVNGLWPAFWMLGTNGETWPACGEIDIMESWNTGDFAQNCIHYANEKGNEKYKSYSTTNKYSSWQKTEWHTYAMYRTDEKIAFYYDNELMSTIIDITSDEMAELRDDYYIILNLAVGGNLTGNVNPSSSSLPAIMEVDYVRYYVEKTEEDYAAEEAAKNAAASVENETTTASVSVKGLGKAKIKSLKNKSGKKMKVSLKKVKGASGYNVRYCDNKKFNGYMQKNSKKRKVLIKKLEKNQKYWVKARAYKKSDGKKTYGNWSKIKKLKIRK